MNLAISQSYLNPVMKSYQRNLIHNASSAGIQSNVTNMERIFMAVKLAMESCTEAGIPIENNFKPLYAGNDSVYDWKLSVLGYRFVTDYLKNN